ncbi:hypothetical protein [Rubripirellula reticaptiva]|uniref:4Fe-4S ferredoxin-type domain-containing protein n=1 Tax=Rubripirellula reticaptiva TaxID=2528013 RepID=A0A5C6F3I9_9BACT|nr:hypothetical protein [Rubripirellula reticaptiva]TWU55070.1 hypothetical protein Poly59_13630 [Rubripirellula reticaptiva]
MSLKKLLGATAATVVAVIALIATQTPASAGLPMGLLDQTGCSKRCPACDHICKFDAKEVEVEKSCFEVESKVICIPRVVFPWQKKDKCGSCNSCDGTGCSSCVNNGARTRRVCVLKTKKYKCPECEYSWSAEKAPCGGGCAPGCCDSNSCDTGCDTTNSYGGFGVSAEPTYAAPQSYGYSQPQSAEVESITVESAQDVPAGSGNQPDYTK